jgi:hypothetical protein
LKAKINYLYNKKPFPNRLWKIIIGILTFLGLILGIITQGFQVWDIFKLHMPTRNSPIIDIRIDPYEYNYGDTINYKNGKTMFTIQSSNGTYKILDSIKFDSLIVIKQDYFIDNGGYPNSVLKEVILNNRILDYRIPEEIGIFKFVNNFILRGDKVKELMISKQKETIGILTLSIPYKFENIIYIEKKNIPIIVYYKDNKLY